NRSNQRSTGSLMPGGNEHDGLPPGWAWGKLGEMCAPVDNVHPKYHFKDVNTFRYIDLSAVEAQRISTPQELHPKHAPSRARQLVRADDTLFSCVRVYLQNVARVPQPLDQQIASTAFAVLRPAYGIDPGYLFWLTRRSNFIREMTE